MTQEKLVPDHVDLEHESDEYGSYYIGRCSRCGLFSPRVDLLSGAIFLVWCNVHKDCEETKEP